MRARTVRLVRRLVVTDRGPLRRRRGCGRHASTRRDLGPAADRAPHRPDARRPRGAAGLSRAHLRSAQRRPDGRPVHDNRHYRVGHLGHKLLPAQALQPPPPGRYVQRQRPSSSTANTRYRQLWTPEFTRAQKIAFAKVITRHRARAIADRAPVPRRCARPLPPARPDRRGPPRPRWHPHRRRDTGTADPGSRADTAEGCRRRT